MSVPRWSSPIKKCMEYLKRYGAPAKEVLPQLQELRSQYDASDTAALELIDKTMSDIQTSTNAPPLISLKDFIAKASAGSPAIAPPEKPAAR